MTKSAPAAFINNDYAGFWRRFAAFLLDGILLSIVSYIPTSVVALCLIGTATGSQESQDSHTWAILGESYLACFALNLFYYSMFECTKQATPGKMLLGLEVTDAEGRKLHFWRAFARNLGKYLSGFFFIGYIMAGFTARKQALHDMMAGCLVLRKHQSKETVWSAAHHNHKTTWTDPSGRTANNATTSLTPSDKSTDGTVNAFTDTAAQLIEAAKSTPDPINTSAASTKAEIFNEQIASVKEKIHALKSESAPQPAATPVDLQQHATPPVFVYQPKPSEQAVSQPTASIAIPTGEPQGEHIAAPVVLASEQLCQTCGAVIDKNFSFCIKCMMPHGLQQ